MEQHLPSTQDVADSVYGQTLAWPYRRGLAIASLSVECMRAAQQRALISAEYGEQRLLAPPWR